MNHLSHDHFQQFIQLVAGDLFAGHPAQLTVRFPDGRQEARAFVFGRVFVGISRGLMLIEDQQQALVYGTSCDDFVNFRVFERGGFCFDEMSGNKVAVAFGPDKASAILDE